MNIWLITTGSSDIQLTNKDDWDTWYREIKRSVYRLPFEPVKTGDDDQERYRLPARVLGIAYGGGFSDSIRPNLVFPLLDNFTQELNHQKIELDQIIVLTSDQDLIFSETDRENKQCPFWQDTCGLYPILENYLNGKFPDTAIRSLILKPQSSNLGLDNWDYVLELVQQEINELAFESELNQIYVSHQAGTPAISSAVQFSSLARFGDRVRFLVSNEQGNQSPDILFSSAYLKGIRKQEAMRLLSRYDYSGIEALLADYFKDNSRVSTLIKAATQWNNAQFDYFLEILSDYPQFSEDVEIRKNNWWWIAYEEAYLAVIREKQENIVEAFFHSFRAFEYIFSAWGTKKLADHIGEVEEEGNVPYLMDTFLDDSRFLRLSGKSKKSISGIILKLKKMRERSQISSELEQKQIATDAVAGDIEKVDLVFFNLANLFKSLNYREYKDSCPELEIFFGKDNIRDQRNKIIHQAKGLSIVDLCNYWKVPTPENDSDREESVKQWIAKLLKLLNFIAKDDLEEEFLNLEEASLMAQVHQELERAIAAL